MKPEGEPFKASSGQPVTQMCMLKGDKGQDLIVLNVTGSGLMAYVPEGKGKKAPASIKGIETPRVTGQFDYIKASTDSKFLIAGSKESQSIQFLKVDVKNAIECIKTIDLQYSFFECDDKLSTVLIMDNKIKTLEQYLINWDFDTADWDKTKSRVLAKLDNQKLGLDGDDENEIRGTKDQVKFGAVDEPV